MSETVTCAEQFEQLLERALLEQTCETAMADHKLARFNFAQKVAQGQALTKADLFDYINAWATSRLAYQRVLQNDSFKYAALIRDCEEQKLSSAVHTCLTGRIHWVNEIISIMTRGSAVSTYGGLFSLQPKVTFARQIVDAISEAENEIPWLRLEARGLKACLNFFPSDQGTLE